MCGRTVCSLAPNRLCHACQYSNQDGNLTQPIWKDDAGKDSGFSGENYNFCPSSYGPVLVSGSQFKEEQLNGEEGARYVQPMKWGLVPSWSKTAAPEYKMVNARVEGLLEKNTFKTPLTKGRRCVIVVDGFYEWAKDKTGEKWPFFVHMPQAREIIWDKPDDVDDSEEIWNGRKLMFIAGLFDINRRVDADHPLYSYTVITVPTSKKLSFMHDRMPAILPNEESVTRWLDFENFPLKDAMNLLVPFESVEYFKVSKNVNNVRYRDKDCVRPFAEQVKVEKKLGQENLFKYFKPSPKKETKSETTGDEKVQKRSKVNTDGDDVETEIAEKKVKKCDE